MKKKLSLSTEDVNNIVKDALENKQKTAEIYSLIRDLREKLPHDEILTLFISMWEIVLIDDNIETYLNHSKDIYMFSCIKTLKMENFLSNIEEITASGYWKNERWWGIMKSMSDDEYGFCIRIP